jgi:4-amino-4-deoxy-L-arabinose transferase-like glycosyltransferase
MAAAQPVFPAERFSVVPDTVPYHKPLLLFLLVLSVLRFWISPIGTSLWLDETVTYWSAYKGVAAALTRSQFWPGQNFAYTLISALAMRIGGRSEIVLRLPSLFAALVTAWLLYRIGARLFDQETGLLAALIFSLAPEVARGAAVNARPYAIALMLVAASVLALMQWLDTNSTRWMLAFIFLSGAISYFHLLFGAIYLVFLIYAIFRATSGELTIPLRNLLQAATLIAVLLSPLMWNVTHNPRLSVQTAWASTPDSAALVSSIMSPPFWAGLVVGILLSYFLFGKCRLVLEQSRRSIWVLLVSWLAVPILTTFLVSVFTAFKIFVPRYYISAFPALALIIAHGLRNISPARVRLIVAASVTISSAIGYGGHHLVVLPHREDWRAAAGLVRAAGPSPTTPVLFRVGLVETRRIPVEREIAADSPLLCPLSKYPIPGRVMLVPLHLDDEATQYVQELSAQVLERSDRFFFLGRGTEDSYSPWLSGWFLSRGFKVSKLGKPQGMTVLVFERQ